MSSYTPHSKVHSHILDIAFPMEGELAISESLPERVLERYLDGGFLMQLQTLGGQCDEDVRSLGRRGRRIKKVDKFVLNDMGHRV